ncbi:hypothetical protein GPJ56_008064 [Histomonas meleagridis]|uniref:uncharacterized protein n=1 Tax=Histomonas meleagridis TaxID=135588 RepID=UPI0035598D9C|nr:hypothetical protein GPJ56_008064 [Histomonas meleagridis]KAH0800306.1 hypothetical protein GO595_006895 [Histomonas meleagridis]
MTPETANKFISDFSASYELLKMFNQAIITALNSGAGAEDKTLQEILPNVNEVHQRLIKLLPTMSDEYVKSIINYLIEFCKLYKASYNKFLKKGSFDVDALREIEAQGIPQREQKKPKKKTTKKKNADDLLDLIGTPQMPPPKQSSPQPAQQETSNTDDLLDLLDLLPKRQEPSMPQNSSQHQPQQPPQPQYTSQPPSHKGTQRKNQQKHKRHQKNEGFEFEEDKGSSVSDQQFIDFLSSIHPKPLSK